MVARRSLTGFWSDESGATAVELGLIVALIALAVVGTMTLLGNNLKAVFTKAGAASV